MEAGKPHNIRPIAPCEARRIEAGIFNYGSDMTIANNPFEVMGLERLVEQQEADYIGKAALERHPRDGRRPQARRHRGRRRRAAVRDLAEVRRATTTARRSARVTDLIWSPRLEKNIGYVWVPIGLAGARHRAGDRGPRRRAVAAPATAAIPFIDPRKASPKA